MFRNFFLVALRNISRNKVFTFINVTGLAIGLAAALLILLWVIDELSFDKFNINGANIFRVEEDQFYSGRKYHVNVTPHPSGPVWMERVPEIKEQTRINRMMRILFRKDDLAFFETSIVAADSGLFRMFTMPFIYGDPLTALRSPNSIVLTEKLADKYFGDINPLGKTLTLENRYQFTVSAVMKNLPRNSSLTFEGVVPYSFLSQIGGVSNSWGSNSILTFLLLEKGSDTESINKKLTDIVKEHFPQTSTQFMVSPMLDIHLHSQFGYEPNNGPVMTIYIFSLIAVFVVLIAGINFVNLSTAKALSRAREIGIKKVTGASRRLLASQFMFESFLLSVMSMLIAFILLGLSLKVFNDITGKNFVLGDLFQAKFILSFLLTGFVTAFLSGIYPAMYLSSVKPVAILKGETITGKGNVRLRQILVVVQFSLSIIIAVASVFMYLQLKYLQDKELGFDKENLISVQMTQSMRGKYYSLKRELLKETLIQGVTASMRNPVMIGSNSGGASWEGKDPEQNVLIGTNAIDYDYMKTMKMELVSGRDFSRDHTGDMARDTTGNFLINEEVARIMGSEDPVGKNFRFMGMRGAIVGVMKNFHFKGADQPIEPIAFALADTNYLTFALIRLTPGNIPGSLKVVEKVWKEVVPEYPLQYNFVDQDYEGLFRTQMRLTGLLKYFTILSLIIACLGLYGLSAYSAERRTNEIGIRKVMGADALHVIWSMAMEYMFLILISLLIAIPAGWIIVKKLLSQFAFRIDISIPVIALIAVTAVLVALVTVSAQAFRATRVNPADALRIEK
jgi:predicted permease